ncbi:zinc finger protein 665-like, partial [Plectropomus leopardus]|uniref:zinc finger protein 665-like n=1 Tax=Plectropomus leopardus TaxID=160734 RepID=UPI001C4CC5B5
EPDRNSHPDTHLQPVSEDECLDSSETEEDWREHDGKPFRCSVCAKKFKHRGNLNIHMRTHTGVKPFSCSLCSKRFTQKAGLDYHMRTHTGEKPFSCSICGKTFRHKGAVTYHMVTHTGVKPFSCSMCGKRFRGTSQVKAHRCIAERRHRGDKVKKPLSCSECDATFPNNYLLVTHMRMHKGKTLFTCSICGQKRQYSSHLEIHMRTHTGEKPFSCSVCGKTFSQRGIMSQHMAVHSGVKPFSCSVCGRRFYWHFQIKKHKCVGESLQRRRAGFNEEDRRGPEPASSDPDKNVQPDTDKNIEASSETDDTVDIDFWKETRQHQSGFTYGRNKKNSVGEDNKTSFSDNKAEPEPSGVDVNLCKQPQSCHLKPEEVSVSETGNNNTDKTPLSCSELNEKSEGHTLPKHKNSHLGEKAFRCLSCGKGFATGGLLTRHISVHTGEKLLSCIVCEKIFTLESQLVNHQCSAASSLPHTANTLQVSSPCGKGLNRKHQLQVPIRIHTGLKPFGCSVCERTFTKRESLRSHMTCHTGEKAFSCSVCNACFSDSEALVQHMRIHTRQTQFSCPVCGKEFAWRRYLTKHMEVHTQERIYSCRYCDQNFLWHYQLRYHKCVCRQSSQLHQSQTEENREAEPPASSSLEQMEADGEDCGGPEPDRNPHPDLQLVTEDKNGDSSETKTDDSDDWKKTSGRLKQKLLQNEETFNNNHLLKIERGNHTGEKQFTDGESLRQHWVVHTGEHRGTKQEDPELPQTKEKQEDPEPPHIKED